MWNNYHMHYWKFNNYDCTYDADTKYSSRRAFLLESFQVYNNSGESKTIWTVGEEWRVPIGEPFQTCLGTYYDNETHRVVMVTFDSREEGEAFLNLLAVLLNAREENETCTMLSRYVWEKLMQADPEKIYQMRKEARAYEEALARKKAQERATAKRLALIKKRANKKRERGDDRRPAHVYIFSFDECFCKIGIANNVADRRRIKIAETGRMIVQWAYSKLFSRETAEEVEQLCHAHFNKSRTYGEFFTITFDEACVYLQSLVKEPLVICKKEET